MVKKNTHTMLGKAKKEKIKPNVGWDADKSNFDLIEILRKEDEKEESDSQKDSEEDESEDDSQKEPEESKVDESTENDKYSVKEVSTNKDGLEQPAGTEAGILPKYPAGMLFVGRTASGKSLTMLNMLTNENLLEGYFDEIVLFVGVKIDDQMFKTLKIKKENIIYDPTEDDLDKRFKQAEKEVEKKGLTKSKKRLFIFDDILGSPKLLKSAAMRKLATAGRHSNISFMILSQYYKGLPPIIRTNCAYIIYYAASMVENEKLMEEQTPPNVSKKEFLSIIRYATKDKYQFLSINTRDTPDRQLRKGFNTILNL